MSHTSRHGHPYEADSKTLALIAYEYIITVNQEVTMIWKRKWTIVTWIFFANRYLMVLNAVSDSLPASSPQVSFYNIYMDRQLIVRGRGELSIKSYILMINSNTSWRSRIPEAVLQEIVTLAQLTVFARMSLKSIYPLIF